MLNKVILIGRLTKDPEVRSTTSGIPVTTFTLAVNRSYTNNGQREADFINCVTFRKTAENVGRFIHKGSLVSVEGRIQTRSYDAQDGSKRYVTEVIGDNVLFLEPKNSQQNNNGNQQYNNSGNQQYNNSGNQQQYQNNNNNTNNNNQKPNINHQQQYPYASGNYNDLDQNRDGDDYFDNVNVDISEDDLPF